MANRNQIIINHDIRSNGGRYIQMPVWISGEPDDVWGKLAIPNPQANSSVGDTSQLYPHGTKFVDGDRTFFYAYCSIVYTANKANLLMFNVSQANSITWGATAGVAGDTKVGILASTLDDDTTPAEDYYAGGWLLPRTNPYSSYRVIKSSEVSDTVSGEVDLTLDNGLVEAVSASQGSCFLNRSQYKAIAQDWAGGSYGAYGTSPGVTLIDPIAATWMWVQAWGPCYVVPYNEEIGTSGNFDCVAHIDGTIKVETRASGAFNQRVGHLYNWATASSTSSWLINLQINR